MQVGSVAKKWLNRLGVLLLVVFALLTALPIVQQNIENSLLMQQPTHQLAYPTIDFSPLSISELRLLSAQLLDGRKYTEVLAAIEHIPIDDRIEFDMYRQAQAMAMMGEMEKAIPLVKDLQISTDVLVELATANWIVLDGEDRLPIAQLWFAIASNRNDGIWVSRRALGAWWRWFEPTRALPYLESVIQEEPDDAFTHYLLGLAYRDVGRLDSAIEHIEEAIRFISYSSPNYCVELSKLYLARGSMKDRSNVRDILALCLRSAPHNEMLRQFTVSIGEGSLLE
jgi:tetratricopeptide (TPR) repeat protein